MARDVLSRVLKPACDVLSVVSNPCGMFCSGSQRMAWDFLSRDNCPTFQWTFSSHFLDPYASSCYAIFVRPLVLIASVSIYDLVAQFRQSLQCSQTQCMEAQTDAALDIYACHGDFYCLYYFADTIITTEQNIRLHQLQWQLSCH